MTESFDPPRFAVVEAVERALAEDLTPLGDITSALLPPMLEPTARFVARERWRVGGSGVCDRDVPSGRRTACRSVWTADDGDASEPGDPSATVSGSLASILTAERTALELPRPPVGHRHVDPTFRRSRSPTPVGHSRLGHPQDHARVCACSRRRRYVPAEAPTIAATCRTGSCSRTITWRWWASRPRCTTPSGVGRAARCTSSAIVRIRRARRSTPAPTLCCSTTCHPTRSARAWRRRARPPPRTTGARRCSRPRAGISLETIRGYAETGVDCISIGQITNSAPVLDIGLDIEPADD